MNFLSKSVACLAALTLASTASAETYIRITGSSAFRAATMNAIKNVMTLSGTNDGYAYTGTSFTGANYAIFKGTLTSTPALGHVTVKCNWSGSVAGIRDVSNQLSISFPDDTTAVTAGGSSLNTTNDLTSVTVASETPNVAMADNTQSNTVFTTNTLAGGGIVGIIPFAWVASKDAPAGMTNMTSSLAKALYKGNGTLSASLFTNNPADAANAGGTVVFATGRDPFSGTRVISFAESGVGVAGSVFQYKVTATNNVVGNINYFPVTGSVPDLGNDGETSGGNLADRLRYTSTSVTDLSGITSVTAGKACFVAYLGEGDAGRAVNGNGSGAFGAGAGNAHYMTYNGVAGFGGRAISGVSCVITNGSTTVTTADTSNIVVGDSIVGTTGITTGTTVASVTNGTTFVLSAAATATSGSSGTNVSFALPVALTSGSAAVVGNTTGLVVGQAIKSASGSSGIPVDTVVASITDGTHFTLSNNATATNSSNATVTNLLANNIRRGAYTFWSYERILWKTSGAGALTTGTNSETTVATAIRTQITNTDYFQSGLANDTAATNGMKAKRSSDGGAVSQTYFY